MGCFGRSVDDLFAYETPKVVRVRHRTLGILHYMFLFCIVAYILVKVIYIDAGYNAHDTPVGSVRVTLQMPSAGVDLKMEDYCTVSPDYNWAEEYPTESSIECRVWDHHSVRYPLDELNAALVSTRVTLTKQKFVCDGSEAPFVCETPYEDIESNTYFLGGVRNYTLGLQHSYFAAMFSKSDPKHKEKYSSTSTALPGVLYDRDGKKIMEFPALFNEMPDVIPVGVLMDAAGADIHAKSPDPNNSLLYSGSLTLIFVSYENDNFNPRYSYRAQTIPNTDFKVYNIHSNSGSERTLVKHAGPKFIFMVTGDVVRFDFQTCLLQFVSAIGLLSVATLCVEFVMLYLLPHKKEYSAAKYDVTQVFGNEESETVDDHTTRLIDPTIQSESEPRTYV